MMNSGSEQDQSATTKGRPAWSDLSHTDCVFLLGYLKGMDPGAFDLALAALGGTLARDAWSAPA